MAPTEIGQNSFGLRKAIWQPNCCALPHESNVYLTIDRLDSAALLRDCSGASAEAPPEKLGNHRIEERVVVIRTSGCRMLAINQILYGGSPLRELKFEPSFDRAAGK